MENMVEIVRGFGVERADAPMLTLDDETRTYGQQYERSQRVANALASAGVGSQDRVAFLDKNSLEYFDVVFGGWLLNAVTVAVNWRLAPPEMEYIVNDSEAKVLVVHEEFLGHLAAFEPNLGHVQKVVVIGSSPTHDSFDDWVAAHPVGDPGVVPEPGDVAMQLYTSGTTGLPKGAQLTHANLAVLLDATDEWQVHPDSVSLVAMPLFHIGGGGWALVALANGAHDVLMRDIDPMAILGVMERHRVTHAFLVPAVLQFLLMVPDAGTRDLSALQLMFYGASPITEDVLIKSMEQLGCGFVQLYGLTETTGAVTSLGPEEHDPGGERQHLLRSAGSPMPGVEIRIVDPDSGGTMPDGEVGEIWIRSPQNMLGYWKMPDETAKALPGDNWFRSGDAGYLRDGHLFIHDRVKDMIISGGENVYPAEVENVLMSHPAIADVAVIGVPDEKWGETPKAIVVPAEGQEVDASEIIAYAKERLAGFKCPTSVDTTDEIPRNPSGKVLKRELREPFWEGHERRVS